MKVREGLVAKRPVHAAIVVTVDGKDDTVGLRAGSGEGNLSNPPRSGGKLNFSPNSQGLPQQSAIPRLTVETSERNKYGFSIRR